MEPLPFIITAVTMPSHKLVNNYNWLLVSIFYKSHHYHFMCCSAVGIAKSVWLRATGYMAGVWFPVREGFFPSPQSPDWLRGPSNQLSNGCRGFFLRGVKWPGSKAGNWSPSIAQDNNGGAILPLTLVSSCSSDLLSTKTILSSFYRTATAVV